MFDKGKEAWRTDLDEEQQIVVEVGIDGETREVEDGKEGDAITATDSKGFERYPILKRGKFAPY